ncbi:MAG: histidinol dehydrogenase [Thermoleophilaceae bacterium]|nr:histidinol dehydrogenase [Thermoleophilaceae bacterium]
MRIAELGPGVTAAEIRALAPAPREVEADVRAIADEVRDGGDAALLSLTARFGGPDLRAEDLRVAEAEIEGAAAALEPELLAALRTAIANVGAVAVVQLRDRMTVELPEGQCVEVVEAPVGRVGAYVPAGRAAYPSTLVMVAVTARAAGVKDIAVCAPPDRDGQAHPVILAACALCGVSEVYRVGGAQAVAALTYGTESIPAVDVIAGPGNRWVQEAKRQAVGVVGIDGIAGPSELVVVAGAREAPEPIALDLLAQGEHGDDGLLVLISPDPDLLAAVRAGVEAMAPSRPTVAAPPLALVRAADVAAAVELADGIAPEHLELVGPEAEALATEVRAAGCVFVGASAATAFGDYVAGSNHVLPTGGAARFQSALSVATFRRRTVRVSVPPAAAARLAPHGAVLARAEGFPVHAESMECRA